MLIVKGDKFTRKNDLETRANGNTVITYDAASDVYIIELRKGQSGLSVGRR